ncbi:hypothetical protein QR680_017531 [Steinernema hermaphroditum]|uniref:Vacuolar protein sorting-associated protein 33A n=1 Tax=Steinernema hermaphroditum TaxID=289476 RepID=A0AA39LP70_9BILA|nr:hypothetical protein QR680_017531 [Steinernema hermaphroditum]
MSDFDDLALMSLLAKRELMQILASIDGEKDLIVQPHLMRPLDKIASMTLLQQHNCSRVQQLQPGANLVWGDSVVHRLYLVRPSVSIAKVISEHIRAEPTKRYSVAFVDRKCNACEREFEKNGVFGLIDQYELQLSFLPIESDLFSLEIPQSNFRHDAGNVYSLAKSLWQLQSLYGMIPAIYGIGKLSQQTNTIMKKLYLEIGEPRPSPDRPISHCFLFDRNVDPITPLLTACTYESMINDTFGIYCGKTTFGSDVTDRLRQKEGNKPKVTALDNNDEVFSAVRNKHIGAVSQFLSAKTKSVQEGFDKATNLKKVAEFKSFVSSELRPLKQQQKLLELHICVCEVIFDGNKGISERLSLEHALVNGTVDSNEVFAYLEMAMCKQQDLWSVLQLACIWSITHNGIPSKQYSQFRSQFLRAYGYDLLPLFHSLMVNNFLVQRDLTASLPAIIRNSSPSATATTDKPTFGFLAKRLNLLTTVKSGETNGTNAKAPNSMNYVFSGAYTPMFCQLVSDTVASGWNTANLKKTFGSTVFCEENVLSSANRRPDCRAQKAILVVFIGGVTYAEVAALRIFAHSKNFRLIVAATHIIDRYAFLKAMANCTCT